MARLNIDTPQVQGNQLPADLNRWFTNVTDQLNANFGNIIADVTGNIGGSGAGPITVSVPGLTANSVVVATIQSSSNAVSVQNVMPGVAGFNITFSGDPGASAIVNYIAFITSWAAQGV